MFNWVGGSSDPFSKNIIKLLDHMPQMRGSKPKSVPPVDPTTDSMQHSIWLAIVLTCCENWAAICGWHLAPPTAAGSDVMGRDVIMAPVAGSM